MVIDIFDLKLGVMALLFVLAIGSCMLPYVVSKYVKNTVVAFSVMNCLSGGVVLGAALSHMIPSATQNFESYFANSKSFLKNYPLTPAISAMGLILLLTIDRTLLSGEHSHSEVRHHEHDQQDHHGSHGKKHHHSHGHHGHGHHGHGHGHGHGHSHGSAKYNANNHSRSGSQKYNTLSPATPSVTQHSGSQKYNLLTVTPPTPTPLGGSQTYNGSPVIPIYITNSPSPAEPLLQEPNSPMIIDVGFNTDTLNRSISDYNAEHKSAVAKTWVFLLALSVHSVLEGLGMGAEKSLDSFYSVLFAVLAHKCLEAFALGLSIYYAKFKRTVSWMMIFGYSIATPCGICAGMLTASLSGNQNLVAGILVSLASGSFLYISLIEILPTELHKPQSMAAKLVAMILGWFGMIVLAYFV